MSGLRDVDIVLTSMQCPKCSGANVRCVDSRPGPRNSIRRRRRCMIVECGYRFTTYETRIEETPLPPAAVLLLVGEVEASVDLLLDRLTKLRQGLEAAQLVDEFSK